MTALHMSAAELCFVAKGTRLLRTWLRTGLMTLLLPLAAGLEMEAAPAYRADRLLVKPKNAPGKPAQGALAGARVQRQFSRVGDLQVLQLPPGVSVAAALAELRRSGDYEYAEPDYALKLMGTTPNDFYFGGAELWGLHNAGHLGGTPGADIKAREAWDIRREAPGVVVALVDSGARLTHQDLAGNLWRNPREIPGNGIDDDANGVVDDVHGFNAWAENGNPMDDIGHGTHVAGTIAAVGNNSVGVVGVAWKTQLMVTKFTDPQGNGTVSDAIACIDYARQMGAQVINASWGAPDFTSDALRDAIAAARDAGIIFVTVAGNGHGSNNDITPVYPANYDLDNIMVTTATNRNDQLAFFANYGATSVDLAAPGQDIFSTWVGSDTDYQYYSGGSMAVAHVTGAVALVKAQFPGENYRQTIARILGGVDRLPGLLGKTATSGRLNVYRALGGAEALLPLVSLAATDPTATEAPGNGAVLTLARSGPSLAAITVNYVVGGTATNGADYRRLEGAVIIPAGATTATITITPLEDTEVEPLETIVVTLSPNVLYALGGTTSATIPLTDNDLPPPLPAVSLAATAAAAGETAGNPAVFTFSRSGATTAPLLVAYAIAGTAAFGADYAELSGSITIPAGATYTTLTVQPINDTLVEPEETIVLTLLSRDTYSLAAGSSATATIVDDDAAPPSVQKPTITLTVADRYAIELSGSKGAFRLARSGGKLSDSLTVKLRVSGTAVGGIDYIAMPTQVTFPAGAKTVTLLVTPLLDRRPEDTETVILTLIEGGTYTIGAEKEGKVWLFDDDWVRMLFEWFGGRT